MTSPSQLDTAVGYIGRGWSVVPIPYRDKGPRIDGWQNLRITEKDAPRYFNGGAGNVGVILGPPSGGLTDVDLDCPEARTAAPFLLPQTGASFGRPSAPDSHWLYVTALADTAEAAVINFNDIDGKRLLELRIGGGKGAQTVFPGSTHKETAEPITWARDGEPAVADGADLAARCRRLAAAALLARHWPAKGTDRRHFAAQALGGLLGRAGWPAAEARLFTEAVARAAGDDEVKDRTRAAADSVENLAKGERNVFGLPKLAELCGKEAANKAAELLGYEAEQAKAAAKEPLPEPTDLWGDFDPPELPEGLLPARLEEFARAKSRLTGADVAGFALAGLVVCGAAIRDRIKLQVKKYDPSWRESARLWVALVGKVSSMKSPIFEIVTKAIREIDNELYNAYCAELERYNSLSPE